MKEEEEGSTQEEVGGGKWGEGVGALRGGGCWWSWGLTNGRTCPTPPDRLTPALGNESARIKSNVSPGPLRDYGIHYVMLRHAVFAFFFSCPEKKNVENGVAISLNAGKSALGSSIEKIKAC